MPVASHHAGPSEDAEVISQSIYGVALQCLETRGAWVEVCGEDAYRGWALRHQFVSREAGSIQKVRVGQLSANVYREPNLKAHVPLLHLPWEARLRPLPQAEQAGDRWLQVCLLDGQAAFILRGDVVSDEPAVTLEAMLALAHRFLGITYTWGGISTFGFDCSGFVQMLHRQRGMVLPRDAQAQCDWAGFVAVLSAELLPGDLLFFTDHPPAVTHVGLFLGDGNFIHSTTEGHPGVQVSRLDHLPWSDRLCAQRRLRR